MQYDIIFITGELFFDHPLCGIAILKRLLEKHGYTVGIIEMPQKEDDIRKLGKPDLFFGISSGSIDSMVRNYTPLKKLREEDPHLNYTESVPDRAVIVFSNWIKRHFKDSVIVLGGTEASLRRFVHYDYWDNRLRKPILFDSRADLLAYGSAEKQILEIAGRIKENISRKDDKKTDKKENADKKENMNKKNYLENIPGTCILSTKIPEAKDGFKFIELPTYDDAVNDKEKFCDMENMFSNNADLAQKIDNRYVLQYKAPKYTSQDLDEYYEMPFTRKLPEPNNPNANISVSKNNNKSRLMQGFEFSVVTHRGCIGECSFCSLPLVQGSRIISRSEESILREIKRIAEMPYFTGNIDDLGGPSANMYGMDCSLCNGHCIGCSRLDRSNKRLINLLRKARQIKGIKKIIIRSGIRYDLASPEYIKEIAEHHLLDTLRIAPEHVNRDVLKLMNKDRGDLDRFMQEFKKTGRQLSFYFMTAHPGSTMKEAYELANAVKKLKNAESVQVFTPTPMTISTCMYYTGLDPKTKKKVYVPYTYREKKEQKRAVFGDMRGINVHN